MNKFSKKGIGMSQTMAPKGLEDVVVDKTELSLVDGEKGILIYRGYNIDELSACSFEEICHLFWYGELPTKAQLENLDQKLRLQRQIPRAVMDFIAASPKTEHSMAILRTAASMLSGYSDKVEDLSKDALLETAISLTAKFSTICAAICRTRAGGSVVEPDMSLGHSANFLKMCTGKTPENVVTQTLDIALMLHADHGFNVSTFTARVVASSLSDMVSAVTAAVGSLKGPLHGGANTAVMQMLLEIGDVANVPAWLENALANKKKVPGFGHRVYTVLDPRAKHLKRMSKEWGERVGQVKWFEMSEMLQSMMLEKKKINANVDFFSASTYYAMGIAPEMFTLLFALARVVGWSSHVIEQLADNRIMRPEALYTGPMDKKYKSFENRS